MKGNESKWAFICFQQFFRIGTFQRVTADSNKENRGPPDSHLRLCETPAARRLLLSATMLPAHVSFPGRVTAPVRSLWSLWTPISEFVNKMNRAGSVDCGRVIFAGGRWTGWRPDPVTTSLGEPPLGRPKTASPSPPRLVQARSSANQVPTVEGNTIELFDVMHRPSLDMRRFHAQRVAGLE